MIHWNHNEQDWRDDRGADLIRFGFQGVCGTGTLQMLGLLCRDTHMTHTHINTRVEGTKERGRGNEHRSERGRGRDTHGPKEREGERKKGRQRDEGKGGIKRTVERKKNRNRKREG